MGPTLSHRGSHTPRLNKSQREEALSLKSSEIDPFVIRILGLYEPHLTFICGSCEPNPFKSRIKRKDPIGPRLSRWQEGPTCQDLLPRLSRKEEREENEFKRFRPLNDLFFSPIERGGEGEKVKPSGQANGGLNRENLVSVPKSSLWSTQWFKPLNVKLIAQGRSKEEGDTFWSSNWSWKAV